MFEDLHQDLLDSSLHLDAMLKKNALYNLCTVHFRPEMCQNFDKMWISEFMFTPGSGNCKSYSNKNAKMATVFFQKVPNGWFLEVFVSVWPYVHVFYLIVNSSLLATSLLVRPDHGLSLDPWVQRWNTFEYSMRLLWFLITGTFLGNLFHLGLLWYMRNHCRIETDTQKSRPPFS